MNIFTNIKSSKLVGNINKLYNFFKVISYLDDVASIILVANRILSLYCASSNHFWKSVSGSFDGKLGIVSV